MVRNFSAFSASFSVNVKNVLRNSTGTESGDYDVLVVMRNMNLLYCECKTGKTISSEEIMKANDRGVSLHSEAIILVSEKPIDERSLRWELLEKLKTFDDGDAHLIKLSVKGTNDFIYLWGKNYYFFSSTGNVENQIKAVLRLINARRVDAISLGYTRIEDYPKMGYNYEQLMPINENETH